MFETLIERCPDAIWLYDPETIELVDCNQAAVELLGAKSKQQLMRTRPEEISPPTQPDGRPSREKAAEIMGIVEREKGHRFEWVIRRLDGTDVLVEVSSTALPMNGKSLHLIISRDISGRRNVKEQTKAERELRTQILTAEVAVALNAGCEPGAMLQRCAELVVRHMDVAFARVWTLNEVTQTLELQASAGCYTHLDGPHSRVKVGEFKIGLIAREKKPHLTNNVQSDPRVGDKEWAAREGMVAFAGYPLLIEDRLLGVLALFARRPLAEDTLKTLGSIADSLALGIERKRAQTALAESEARFSAAFHASPALIGILCVRDGKYVLVNDAHLNWLGYAREEVLGRSCLELGMWVDTAERDMLLKDMGAFGAVRQRECRWRNRYGGHFTVLLSAETITLNHTPHMLLMALDITQRKNLEVEMVKALTREKELSQLKSNFVSMVSHEFRTPLGIIQSSAELLSDFYQRMEPGEREAQLESITGNTRRMACMMEEILVLSRLEAGKLEFQPAAIDLNMFCRRVVDEVISATNRRCEIELALKSVPAWAEGDERVLGHIFTNLLSNAVKYSEPGATVRFEIERDGQDAVCLVQDQGIGISHDDQQQLFKAFYRGSNVGTRPGTGLGLMLVKRCADLHRGKVQVSSKVGEGTRVAVRLPLFERDHEKDTSH